MPRPRLRPGAILAILLAPAVPAGADPPVIGGTGPFGVQRGAATDLAIQGANLAGNPQLVAPFPFAVEPAPASDAGTWRLKLTAAPGTAVGVYPIRVKTDDGISNPFLLAVGQVPQVGEAEDNSTFEAAQAVPSPVVVEGQAAGNDVDFFKFPGKKGQRIVVDAQCARIGSGVDPTLRLTTARRGFLAAAEDAPGLGTDARLAAVLPEDGDYVVEISDTRYQGGGRPVYRLLIGPVPVADEVFPLGGRRGESVALEFRGGTLPDARTAAIPLNVPPDADSFRPQVTGQALGLADEPREVELVAPLAVGDLPEAREPADPAAAPSRVTAPATINGRIDPAGDEDRFVVAVTPGRAYRARVHASALGSALDGQLQVLGANGAGLASGDDQNLPPAGPGLAATVSPDPSVDFTPPGGLNEVTLVLRDLEGRGGVGFPYRIVVEPIRPTFEARLNDGQVSVPKGGTAVVGVTVARQGFNGPIALTVANPPPGLTVRPGTIPAGQAAGALTVSAAGDAAFGPVELRVVGEGDGPEGPIVKPATRVVVFAQQGGGQQGTVPTNLQAFVGLPAAPALPGAVSLEAPAGPVEVVHGYGAPLPIKVARTPGADGALALAPLPLPAGITVPAATIAEKAGDGAATVNAALEAPLGKASVALTAKGKFANKDQTFAVPLVTIEVVRPAAVELAAPGVEVKPGDAVEVKGKVVRRGPFKEPVAVRIDGLPAGLKADPVTLPPDAADFTLKLAADGGAPAATAAATVAIAFQVNKKDYATPPAPLAIKVLPK